MLCHSYPIFLTGEAGVRTCFWERLAAATGGCDEKMSDRSARRGAWLSCGVCYCASSPLLLGVPVSLLTLGRATVHSFLKQKPKLSLGPGVTDGELAVTGVVKPGSPPLWGRPLHTHSGAWLRETPPLPFVERNTNQPPRASTTTIINEEVRRVCGVPSRPSLLFSLLSFFCGNLFHLFVCLFVWGDWGWGERDHLVERVKRFFSSVTPGMTLEYVESPSSATTIALLAFPPFLNPQRKWPFCATPPGFHVVGVCLL